MKKYWLLAALCGFVCLSSAMGQGPPNPQDRPDGRGPGGPPQAREGNRPPPNPIIEALDANHDHNISADEIGAAATALKSLDHNGDGQLSEDEFHPAPPRRPEGGPPDARRDEGARGPDSVRGRDSQPPPRERNRDGRRSGPPDRGPGPGAPGPGAEDGGPPETLDGGEDRPRGPGGRGQDRRPREDGPPSPPSPERMIEHAMEFDANGDGSLNREELLEFARQMPPPPPRGGPDGPPDRGPDGGPTGRRAPDDGPTAQSGDRPQRPRRPE